MLHPLTSLVTMLATLVYAWTVMMAGRMRGKHKIMAPAVTGHPDFECALRVQQNTVEQLLLFFPSLWIFATTVSEFWAAMIGLVFVAGRVVYALGYYSAPERRAAGFGIGFLAIVALMLGAIYGAARMVFFGI